jgi:hypothetical protein
MAASNFATANVDPTIDPLTGKKITTQPVGPLAPDPAAVVPPVASASTMPPGMDPALAAIYQGSGLDPSSTRGTGFADWQYWQDVGPSQYARLAADIAGKGSDAPTGTPGQGAWGTSGSGARLANDNRAAAPVVAVPGVTPVPTAAPIVDPASPLTTGPNATNQNALMDLLMSRAKQSEVVDPNDPVLKAQTDAYNADQTRTERQYEAGLAEKGGPNANMSAERRAGAETVGQNEGSFQAKLMGQELVARRTEIAQALQGASGLLTAEQAMQLQEELTKLDDQIRQSQFVQGQGQQESQFGRSLAQSAFAQGSQMDYNYAALNG